MEKNEPQTVPKILARFAHLLGAEVKNRRVDIPEKFGSGYCAGFVFNEQIRMIISNYELKEDLMVYNPDINAARKAIFFKFRNIFPKAESAARRNHLTERPSVLIATSRIHTDDVISIHTNTATITIEVEAAYLKSLFDWSEKSLVLQSLLDNTQPLLFEELVFPALQHIVDELVAEPVDEPFELFFRRVKAEELICRLLMALEKREETQLYALNSRDLATLYNLKEQMLERLETPPVIAELAGRAHMSPTKLKRLFKQIFGTSLFRYYQQFRMQEAARLLKEEKLSVSEVGYRLGFTNLSHFSRVFTAQIGTKPKQFGRRVLSSR